MFHRYKPLWLCLFLLPGIVQARDYTFLPALPFTNAMEMPLLDVATCGERTLAVGERGLIIFSDDNGASWTQAQVPVSQTLTAVYCLPESKDKAWAVGHSGVILASDDSGASWSGQFDGYKANQQWLDYAREGKAALEESISGAPAEDISDLEYALEDAVFAVEDAQEASETGPADPFLDIWFKDTQTGLAVGAYGMIYRTEDGGENWSLSVSAIDNPDRYHYYSIEQDRDGNLFLSGEAGLLYRSKDLGMSWERLETGYDGSLFGIVVSNDGAVLVFGLRGNVLRSVDAGDNWGPVVIKNNSNLSLYGGARLGDGSIALVGATGALLTSIDNGLEFRGEIMPGRNTLSAVAGNNLGAAWAAGMGGLEAPAGAAP